MKFDRIHFAQMFVSGGGRLIIKDLSLRMRRLLFQNLQSVKRPYTLYADLLLTQRDIVSSPFIRNLIQSQVDTILERVLGQNIVSVSVRKVSIRQRRVHASGVAKLLPVEGRKVEWSTGGLVGVEALGGVGGVGGLGEGGTGEMGVGAVGGMGAVGAVGALSPDGLVSVAFEISTGLGTVDVLTPLCLYVYRLWFYPSVSHTLILYTIIPLVFLFLKSHP
ncbi:hypothetical protein B484DRAFT_232047 [Ochromonadaceae sp. CCMP2298]|nr:hypothetical protein B484DRAFT_232047 [Ochromonadaceae sp. CCMP2298]